MGKFIHDIKESFRRGRQFVMRDVWRIGRPGEELPSGLFIKQIRVVFLLLSKLVDGNMMLRASALTFATLLSVVPLLAVTFYIIQTFNLGESLYTNMQDKLEDFIVVSAEKVPGLSSEPTPIDEVPVELVPEKVPPVEEPVPDIEVQDDPDTPEDESAVEPEDKDQQLQQQFVQSIFQGVGSQNEDMEDPVVWLVDLANDMAALADEAAKNTAAFGLSTLLLVFTTVFGLMRNIEKSFNSIWGVRRTRSWYRMISDYVMITLLIPFVMAGVLGVTGALSSERIVEALGPLSYGLQFVQYFLIVLVFSSLYYVVPNTRVRYGYALFGGVIAGALWILLSWTYINFQIGLARYQAVLSVFAQFPMLLMWVYSSWAIVLFGSEITYAYQNEKTFTMERFADNASFAYRAALGLRAMIELGRRFQESAPSLQPEAAALEWNVPSRLVRETLERLEESGFIAECATDPVSYQPARPLDKITAGDILQSLHERGEDPSLFLQDEAFKPLYDEFLRPTDGVHRTTIAELIKRVAEQKESSVDEETHA
ncbi:MAG: YhjD/YihY/BrkB family envelope integrity protein [Candidatus Hydrogenedentota bacterium]